VVDTSTYNPCRQILAHTIPDAYLSFYALETDPIATSTTGEASSSGPTLGGHRRTRPQQSNRLTCRRGKLPCIGTHRCSFGTRSIPALAQQSAFGLPRNLLPSGAAPPFTPSLRRLMAHIQTARGYAMPPKHTPSYSTRQIPAVPMVLQVDWARQSLSSHTSVTHWGAKDPHKLKSSSLEGCHCCPLRRHRQASAATGSGLSVPRSRRYRYR
jgi:hypothetical protein